MKVLWCTHSVPLYDWLCGVLRASLPGSLDIQHHGHCHDDQGWQTAAGCADIVVSCLPATGALQDPVLSSSVALLRFASGARIPSIVAGASLDPHIVRFLHRNRVNAYVGLRGRDAFVVEFIRAIHHVLGRDVQTAFFNVHATLSLTLLDRQCVWTASGGYFDSVTQSSSMPWVPRILALVSECSDLVGTARLKAIDRIGGFLGPYLLSDSEAEGFYARACQVIVPSRLPVCIHTPERWVGLPFEAAILPQENTHLKLSHVHPVYRRVKGRAAEAKWKPRDGMNVLVVAANTYGKIECPLGGKECKANSLAPIDAVLDEGAKVTDMFRAYGDRHPGKIDTVSMLAGRAASVHRVKSELGNKEWNIVHFAGHGLSCVRDGHKKGCVFVRRRGRGWFGGDSPAGLSIDLVTALLAQRSSDAMVYLSCCRSVDSGLTHSLAASKSGEVIGYQLSVDDRSAADMAVAFYSEMIRQWEKGISDVAGALLAARSSQVGQDPDSEAATVCVMLCLGFSDKENP